MIPISFCADVSLPVTVIMSLPCDLWARGDGDAAVTQYSVLLCLLECVA